VQLRGKGFDQAGDDINAWEHWSVENSPHIAICLAQPGNSRDTWRITVISKNDEGDFEVGTILTRSPAAGDPANRVVCLAYVPGTRHWRVIVQGPQNATADIVISAQKDCCGGGAVAGVQPTNGSFLETSTWTPFFAPAQQGQISANPGTLYKFKGFVDPAQPLLYVGVVDKATPVVNNDPWLDIPVQLLALSGANFSISWDPRGIKYANGLQWACSSTPALVTLAGAASVSAERV
jgi:hypothetical protein